MFDDHIVGYGCAICTPVPKIPAPGGGTRLSMVTTEWQRARNNMQVPTNFNSINIVVDGMEVGDARNKAVSLTLEHDPKPEFLFFLDYDVIVPHDALCKLHRRARDFPDHDIFGGVYCIKNGNGEPLIYKGNGKGPFWEWSIGDLLSDGITGLHMGLTLIRTSLLERMDFDEDNPLFKTINEKTVTEDGKAKTRRGTEDLYFCDRAIEEAGAKILIDTSVLAGHIDHSSGKIYGLPSDSRPVMGAGWVDPKKREKNLNEKKVIDLGAGKEKREWEGYKTYTTDIREGVGADHVMDTRELNFPDGWWDMVASSHHLEHIPRYDQERVWEQMFRITKPGGSCEHIVPSLNWAAQKIHMDDDYDGHVANVLYGAQESHGYDRIYNTHFFGYTRTIAKEIAEAVGYVDVEIEDYKDNPDLRYNMIIRGRKPGGPDDCKEESEKPGKEDELLKDYNDKKKKKSRVVVSA